MREFTNEVKGKITSNFKKAMKSTWGYTNSKCGNIKTKII